MTGLELLEALLTAAEDQECDNMTDTESTAFLMIKHKFPRESEFRGYLTILTQKYAKAVIEDKVEDFFRCIDGAIELYEKEVMDD